MDCEEFEVLMLESPDNEPSSAMEAHRVGCAQCQVLAEQARHLDAALARVIKRPSLRPDFSARLHQRIQAETTTSLLSETQRAERRRQLETEFENGLARLSRQWLNPAHFFGSVPLAVLAAAVGWLILELLPQGNLTSFVWALSGAAIFVGIATAVPRRFRKLEI